MSNFASRVTDDNWADRFEQATTDHEAMGHAWSYLLAHMAHAGCTTPRLNEIRRQVTAYLIDTAQTQELR